MRNKILKFRASVSILIRPLSNEWLLCTSHMARCFTFAVATIQVKGLPLETGEILHIFPSGTESMGDRGSKKAYTGPTKFGCDR